MPTTVHITAMKIIPIPLPTLPFTRATTPQTKVANPKTGGKAKAI
jgi:hypothetical protein